MKKIFSIRSLFQYTFVLFTLAMFSCKGTDVIEPEFIMTTENTQFDYADASVNFKKALIQLQQLPTVTSTMPKYFTYSFFVDTVFAPIPTGASDSLISATNSRIKLAISTAPSVKSLVTGRDSIESGLKTGKLQIDNTSSRFVPGVYKIIMGAFTKNGKVIFTNSPITLTIKPGIDATTFSKTTALNYTEDETISAEGSFRVESYYSGLPVTVTLNSPDFEMSATKTTTFSATNSLTYTPANAIGEFSNTVYLRMKTGLSAGTVKEGTITVSCAGFDPITVDLKGLVYARKIKCVDGSNVAVTKLFLLDYALGAGPSAFQGFTVSGYVNDKIVATLADSNFEISFNRTSSYAATLTLPKLASGIILDKLLYVRLKKDLPKGKYTDKITFTSTNITPYIVTISGEVF